MIATNFKINGETFKYWVLKGPAEGPILHWAHGNGFNAYTYHNLLKELSKSCTVYAWDARSHGLNSNLKDPETGNFYNRFSEDLIKLTEHLYKKHNQEIILAGHSFGATLCIRVENALRDKISKIILADPVLYTRFYAISSLLMRALKFKYPKDLYLAERALSRQNSWESVTSAISSLSRKPLFKDCDKSSLENYINYGTCMIDGLIKLNCSPIIEAQIFRESEKEYLASKIASLSTETHIFYAAKGSPSFAKRNFKRARTKLSESRISGSNHSFPIEMSMKFAVEVKNAIFDG